jgi:hypothetical protein
MVNQLRNSGVRKRPQRDKVACLAAMALFVSLFASSRLAAQTSNVHYRYQGNEPPGAIGAWQLMRGGPLPGYFQPVEIRAPQGVLISLAVDGNFGKQLQTPFRVGLLIAPVYRLRVTNIPLHEGEEVYPTIEVIDRLYPPAGQAVRFPIPIELTQEDLELALEGNYVTRVVYLEDPEHVLPSGPPCKEQNWFDAGPGANPVQVADRLGRPMAIIRLGGRVPDNRSGPDCAFLAGCPPFVPLPGSCDRPCGPEPVPVSQETEPISATDSRPSAVPLAEKKSRLGSTATRPATNRSNHD